MGFRMRTLQRGANSARNIAHERPRVAPMTTARSVTSSEPTIIGRIPKLPLLGAQLVEAMKFQTPTLATSGTPSRKMR